MSDTRDARRWVRAYWAEQMARQPVPEMEQGCTPKIFADESRRIATMVGGSAMPARGDGR